MSSTQGFERLLRRVGKLENDVRDTDRPLKAAGVYMLGSIERNFQAQGRPDKWTALNESTLARRRKGRGKGRSQILIDTAHLKNSTAMRLTGDGVEIGTNVIYAPRQHFGYEGGEGRGQAETPARPFLMFQDEDIDAIGNIFRRHIERG